MRGTTEIISCETIRKEVEKALQETGCNYPISWVESGLHNVPKKLTAALQEMLDEVKSDRVLLAMGFCGNSLKGLRTGDFELIIPRVDDCITLLLGAYEERKKHERTYFLTEGWLNGEQNIYEEYKYTISKYGPELGEEIFQMILGQYKHLGMLDTGIGDFEELTKRGEIIAEALNLQLKRIKATDRLLKSLLTGPWPESSFKTIGKFSEITLADLTLPS